MRGHARVPSSGPYGVCAAYHFVFIPKYREPVLRGEIGTEVRDLIREICRSQDVEILQGHLRPDHVHLRAERAATPCAEPGDAGDQGEDMHHFLIDHRKLRSEYWGRHLWALGYFVCSSGQVTDEVIAQSIKLQVAEPDDEDRFRVSDT